MKDQTKLYYFLVMVSIFLVVDQIQADKNAIEKATQFLLDHQNEDGSWSLIPGDESDAEVTAITVQALLAKGFGTGAPTINRAVAYLIKQQREDGSWNGNTAHTIFALVALKMADRDPKVIFKGLTWLDEAQNANGSWGRELGAPGNILYTAAVLSGLKRLVTPRYSSLNKAANWLADPNRMNDDGAWSLKRLSTSEVMVTSWVLQGLSATYDVDDRLVWLKKMQNPDHGFANFKGKPSDPEITAYVILTLVASQDPLNTDLVASAYLKQAQLPDGSFKSATPIELKQPQVNIQTTSFALLALNARRYEKLFQKK